MMASLDDRLDKAIADALSGHPASAQTDVAALLEPALPLLTTSLPAPTHAQAFLRMQDALIAERARRQKGFLHGWRSFSWRGATLFVRGAFLAAGAAAVLLLLLAPRAQPDDPHYPLKRSIEAVHLLFVQDAGARADLYAQLAERRLIEAETAAAAGHPVPAEVFDSLGQAWDRVAALAGPDDETLRAIAQAQQGRIQVLLPLLEADVQPAATAAQSAIRRFLTPTPPAPTPIATAAPTRTPNPSPTPTPGPAGANLRPASTATLAPPATSTPGTGAGNLTPTRPASTQPPSLTPQPTESPTPPDLDPTRTAEATETPEPTHTPRATPAPESTEEPEPTRTPDPARTPERTETPEPTEAPEPTRTPRPTSTPRPTERPEPTRTPETTGTPERTETPEPTERPERTETPEPAETPEARRL